MFHNLVLAVLQRHIDDLASLRQVHIAQLSELSAYGGPQCGQF